MTHVYVIMSDGGYYGLTAEYLDSTVLLCTIAASVFNDLTHARTHAITRACAHAQGEQKAHVQ